VRPILDRPGIRNRHQSHARRQSHVRHQSHDYQLGLNTPALNILHNILQPAPSWDPFLLDLFHFLLAFLSPFAKHSFLFRYSLKEQQRNPYTKANTSLLL
jgi:hypothetical protein